MNRFFSTLGRGVSIAAVVVLLAVPNASAAISRDGDGAPGSTWTPSRIVHLLKRFVGRIFGDELVVPHP